ADRIGEFMMAHIDGFDSLEEVADAVAAYNPHRRRPTNLSGLKKNVRQREDGRWFWHWDPAFMVGRFGSADETRTSVIQPERLERAAKTLTIPTLLVRGRMSDLLTDDGSKEFLEMVPHAGFVEVGGAGHMVAGDRNDLFNDAIVEFLRDLAA
ncbi:MAG: alpha/beta hydrolase, partial [Acidimicrobiia bacterium]|nr:alpha/beta hydrolase [Acidimicrobiia bacterium]